MNDAPQGAAPRRWPLGDRLLAALGVPLALGLGVASTQSWWVERNYVPWLGPTLARGLGWASALSPVSLSEWVEVGAGLVALGWLGLMLWRLWRGERGLWLARGAARVVSAALVVGCWFYLAWGLGYARPPAAERLGLETLVRVNEADPVASVDELARLAAALVDASNHRYLVATGTHDLGEPSVHPAGLSGVEAAVEPAYARVAERYGLEAAVGWSRAPARPVLASQVMSYLGIGGFYFPFTGEANLNALQPGWQLPHTLAHEKAHQRFVNSEDEANFFGFLACLDAEDAYVQYAGLLWAQRSLLFQLGRYDRWRMTQLVLRRFPGVQRDVNESRRFWSGYKGPAMDLSSIVNDAYLKLNRVPGGVESYGRANRLLVLWARSREGVVWPADVPWRVMPGAAERVSPSLPWSGGVPAKKRAK